MLAARGVKRLGPAMQALPVREQFAGSIHRYSRAGQQHFCITRCMNSSPQRNSASLPTQSQPARTGMHGAPLPRRMGQAVQPEEHVIIGFHNVLRVPLLRDRLRQRWRGCSSSEAGLGWRCASAGHCMPAALKGLNMCRKGRTPRQ